MFKTRSPFAPPTLSGQQYRRNKIEQEVKYPSKTLQKKNRGMSIEEPDVPRQPEVPRQGIKTQDLKAVSLVDEKFCFQLNDPWQDSQGTVPQQDLYWMYELTQQVSGEHSRKVIFREQQYFVRSDSGTPYQTIYIAVDGITGFKDQRGVASNKVCALHLTQVSSLIDDSGQKVYDLVYKQVQDFAWQLPMNLGQLKFRIYADSEKKQGPLGVPLVCQFDIRHTAR